MEKVSIPTKSNPNVFVGLIETSFVCFVTNV